MKEDRRYTYTHLDRFTAVLLIHLPFVINSRISISSDNKEIKLHCLITTVITSEALITAMWRDTLK